MPAANAIEATRRSRYASSPPSAVAQQDDRGRIAGGRDGKPDALTDVGEHRLAGDDHQPICSLLQE